MTLWFEWIRCASFFRETCSRHTTFLWMMLVLAAFSIRSELAGVTSFVRATALVDRCYHALLHVFHSSALRLDRLTATWIRFVLRFFEPLQVHGRVIFLADGLKVGKEGRKMPAVKRLHQASQNNSKPTFIFGHSFQAIGLLVTSRLASVFCVPLASRIHEGVRFSHNDHRTLLDRLVALFFEVADVPGRPALLVADAYYASRKVILPLLQANHHLITRVRRTTTAYRPAPQPKTRGRGRPRTYGRKVFLGKLWTPARKFTHAQSPVYNDHGLTLRYRSLDLLWRPVGTLVRFVLVEHPTRGRLILLCTDLSLQPLDIIRIYGYRFKVEVSFRQAIHTLGTYAYHFWMADMLPLSRRLSGDQNLHSRSHSYKEKVRRKIDAYHRYVQLGCIAQGLLQYLAITCHQTVWRHFHSWMRTMKPDSAPSEAVVAQALRSTFPQFLLHAPNDNQLKKFIISRLDTNQCPWLKLAG